MKYGSITIKKFIIGLIIVNFVCIFILSSDKIKFLIIGLYLVFMLLVVNKFNFEKTTNILFSLSIPFLVDIDFGEKVQDYHMAAKTYFRFNFIFIFASIFLIYILINIKKVKIKYDLIIIFLFNFICIISIFWAKNKSATFFDSLRYMLVFIIYIYFSRIFNYKKNADIFLKCLIIGSVFQLILGILQIIKGGAIGLHILGESQQVFRVSVSGYEKGMSGTFGHPGPLALYSLFILSWTIFSKNLNPIIRSIGIYSCSLIIILAAGRTSILLMILVLVFYNIDKYKNLNVKNIIGLPVIVLSLIILLFIFRENFIYLINRFINSDMDHQFNSRMIHINLALFYITQKPILGLGLNNYLDYTISDFPADFYSNFFLWNPIHNAYFLLAVEIGIIGSLLYILIILNGINYYRKFKALKCKCNQYKGFVVSMLICFIYNFQGWGALHTRSLIIFFIGLAFTYNLYNIEKGKIISNEKNFS